MIASRRYITIAGLALGAALVASLFYGFGLLNSWQDTVTDRFFLKSTPPSDVVIVAVDEETITNFDGWPLPRATFARVLEKLSLAEAVAIDIAFNTRSPRGPGDDQELGFAIQNFPNQIVLPVQFDARGGNPAEPLGMFMSQGRIGFINVLADYDGTVRSTLTYQDPYQSFSAALLTEATFPSKVRINYAGPEKTFPTISFLDVYKGAVPTEFFEGKTVLLGATAPSLHDIVETPFGLMPGVEVHANVLSTLRSGNFLSPIPPLLAYGAIFLSALLGALLILSISRLPVLLVSLLLGFLGINLSGILLFGANILFPTLAVSLSYLLSAGSVLVFQYLTESKEKKFIRKSFQYYLTPSVVEEIIKNPKKLALGGERKPITIFFSDIRGFTSISEKLSPEGLTHLINEYLTDMTDIIMDRRGLVDKYIGDAIMAFWGAPVENQEASVDACRSVVAMGDALKHLNAHWKEVGLPELAFGAGLNRGEVIVGNMGSKRRFNYTIMGDEVNFCSRLEGLTKAYGVTCLISEPVAKDIAEEKDLQVRELDLVIVKGKKEPRRIYELLIEPVEEKVLVAFERGRVAYAKGEWDTALSVFEEVLAMRPADGPSKAFLERTQKLKDHPPQEWNGVYEFTSK